MKVLVLAGHIDGLEMPEGKDRFPHAHQWSLSKGDPKIDKFGRPYCTKCGGMPIWFVIKEVEKDSFGYKQIMQNGGIELQRDSEKKSKTFSPKKKTKKVEAKINLLKAYHDKHDRSADNLVLPGVQDWLKTIGDEDLDYLVKAFVKAQKELDDYMVKIKEEVTPFLPDESDF